MKKILNAQQYLKEAHIDGWLLYYFDKNNFLALDFLAIDPHSHLSRRFFYWVPQQGEPVKIVHTIEPHVLAHMPGRTIFYHRREELDKALKEILNNHKSIAMEYSENGDLPYVSKVDGGMIEKIRSFGPQIVSSASFLQYFTCVMNQQQVMSQKKAGAFLDQLTKKTWLWIQTQFQKTPISELQVLDFMMQEYEKKGFYTEFAPTVAFGVHTADPHYQPTKISDKFLKENDVILLDCVAKTLEKHAVYADITRMGFAGKIPHENLQYAFKLLLKAQKTTYDFIAKQFEQGIEVKGFEADRVCRDVIEKAHMGEFFTHRTGHNLFEKVHGPGAHLDGFETLDDRPLIPMTSFTIEPGLYFPNHFGVRVEYDVWIDENKKLEVVSGIQNDLFLF